MLTYMPFSRLFNEHFFHLSVLGESKTTVAPFVPGGVSDGQWHSVQLHYYNKVRYKVIFA